MSCGTHQLVGGEHGLAWLALGLCADLTPFRAHALLAAFGTPEAALAAPVERLVAAGLPTDAARALDEARERAGREAGRLRDAGATWLAWDDPAYPAALRAIADPPVVLAVRGALTPEDALAVAVVGARRASEYGRRVAAELATGLAQAGVTVVSGLATGIDAAAHRAALAAGGRTVAVLGTGIDRVYPAWHAALAAQIAGQGALVSEFPCGAPPFAHHFPRRNRLISGLGSGTVVVEAAEQSGSLITARYALEQGREVFAVPGPIGVAAHRGPHRLIQEGAKLITAVEDILAELVPALVGRVAAARADAARALLTTAERRLLDAVGSESRHLDDVVRYTGMAVAPALETLLALELRGLVHQLPGKRFRRAA